jgi:hypothetical protein
MLPEVALSCAEEAEWKAEKKLVSRTSVFSVPLWLFFHRNGEPQRHRDTEK